MIGLRIARIPSASSIVTSRLSIMFFYRRVGDQRPFSPAEAGHYVLFFHAGGVSAADGSTRLLQETRRSRVLLKKNSPDLLISCSKVVDHFASGSGLTWNCITLLVVPLPPSMWNGARVLIVAH